MLADLFRQLLKNCLGPAKWVRNSVALGVCEPGKMAELRQFYVFLLVDFQFQVALDPLRLVTGKRMVVA